MGTNFYLETYLHRFTFYHYLVELVNIPESSNIVKIKDIKASILQLEDEKVNENNFIIQGIIELEISYVIANVVKFYNTRVNFNFLKGLKQCYGEKDACFPENCKLLIKASSRAIKNSLLPANQVEVKIAIVFQGCFKVFQDCSSIWKCADIEVNCVPAFESHKKEDLSVGNIAEFTQAFNIAQKELITFFVKNKGDSLVYVQLEISPNGVDWIADAYEVEIPPGQGEALVLATFLKYTRLKYYSLNSSLIDIYLQTQG